MFNLNLIIMKTVKFFVGTLISAVLFTSSVIAAEKDAVSSKEKASHDVIRDQMMYTFSDIAVESNTDVYILFSVNEESGFQVKEVESIDKSVAGAVKARLKYSKIVAPTSLSGDYLIKIRFVTDSSVENKISDSDVLRSLLKENLSSLELPAGGSVNVKFSVKENALALKSVEGANENLVKAVESVLSKSSIETPSGIAGNYQVKVTF